MIPSIPLIPNPVTVKFETIHSLLKLIENYQPIYTGTKERQRLEHYRDVIQEDIAYIVAALTSPQGE